MCLCIIVSLYVYIQVTISVLWMPNKLKVYETFSEKWVKYKSLDNLLKTLLYNSNSIQPNDFN